MAAQEQRDPREQLPVELGILLDAMRGEFNSKIASLKAWGLAMCLAGGTIGGLVGKFVAPDQTSAALHAVSHLFV